MRFEEIAVGQAAETSKTVTETDVVLYAGITGDFNPAHVNEVEAADFASEHLFVYNVPRPELTIFNVVLGPAGVQPRQLSRVELTEAIVELVRAGLGVGVLARWAVAPHLRSGSLRAVRITRGGIVRQWSAATVRRKSPPLHIQAFVELLREMVEPLPTEGPEWCAA